MDSLSHTVVKGDTLWRIGRDHGINWRILAAWNKISDPNKIYIAQKIKIPGGAALQLIIDFLEALAYVASHKIAALITILQAIANGSNMSEIKELIVEYGLESAFLAILARIHPYAFVAGTLLLLLRWGYNKYYKSDEK